MLDYFHMELDWAKIMDALLIPCCILLAALSIGILLNNLINRQIQKNLSLDEDSWKVVFVRALHGVPISWCLGVGLYWTINSVEFSPTLTKLFSYILFANIIFTLTRVVARTLTGMIDIHAQRSGTMPKSSLLTNIVNIIVYAMGVLIVLQYYGISVAPIITALGVGGMAVALGLQEILANIFSGLHLTLSKQLRIGDYIELSTGQRGQVTDITWRFTTIRSATNNVVVVPNKTIASAVITNFSMPQEDVAIVIPVGVSYDSDLAQVERVTLEVAAEVMQRMEKGMPIEPAVRFHTFGDSSIDFNVILHSGQFASQFELQHEFIKALTKRYREEGIEIPYPVRTVLEGKA